MLNRLLAVLNGPPDLFVKKHYKHMVHTILVRSI